MREHGTTAAPTLILAAALAGGLTVGAAAPDRAAAQPAGEPAGVGDTITLTLDRALAVAEGNNPAYRRALNQLDVGGPQARATWMGQVLPNVNLSVLNTGYSGSRQLQALDEFGRPVDNPESNWVYSSSTSQSLNLNWSLQGKSLFNSLEDLDLGDRGRDLAVERADFTTSAQVRRQYYVVLRQRELLTTETDALAALERDLEETGRLYRFAERTRVDVLNAELAVEDQRRLIQQQQRAFDQSRLTLRTTMGDPNLPPFRLEEVPLPVFDPSTLDDGALVERALTVHPDIRQAQVDLDQARLGVSQAKASRWPNLNLSYRLGRQAYNRDGSGALFDVSHEPNELNNNFGISLSLPYLNNYFQNRSGEVQAEVALRNQRESVKETELQVEQQVRSQLIELRNQYESLRAAERRHEIAGEALELARQEYRLGTRTFQELDDQVTQERDARRDLVTARYGFVDALLNLEEALGATVRGEPPVTDGEVGGAAGASIDAAGGR